MKVFTMKNTSAHKQKGVMSVDLMLTVGAVIGALVLLLLLVPSIRGSIHLAGFQKDAAVISNAAYKWKGGRSNYTGITIGDLCKNNYLEKGGAICGTANTATSTNSYGGNWTVAAASNPGLYIVTGTLPNDPDSIAKVADTLAPTTRGNCQSATGCSTIATTTTSVAMTY